LRNSSSRWAEATLFAAMKKPSLALLLFLPALLAFGRNVTEQDIATALKRALRTRDNLTDGTEVQVSSALATGKDVCIEYRASSAAGQTISGLAVYRTDDNLVFLDNSWIWERACLSGKYGQRRNGKDVTRALNASLSAPIPSKPVVVAASAVSPVPAAVSAASPTAAMIAPATPKVTASVPMRSAPPQPTPPVAIASAAAPVVTAVPVRQTAAIALVSAPSTVSVPAPVQAVVQASAPAAPVVIAAAPSAPVASMPTPAAAAVNLPVAVNPPVPAQPAAPVSAPMVTSVATVASAPAPAPIPQQRAIVPPPAPVMSASASIPDSASTATRSVTAYAQQMSAPPEVAIVSHLATAEPASTARLSNTAASVETPLHGVNISDDTGALGPPTSSVSASAPQESLADAARRMRRNQ
jgi:hypothetical protein